MMALKPTVLNLFVQQVAVLMIFGLKLISRQQGQWKPLGRQSNSSELGNEEIASAVKHTSIEDSLFSPKHVQKSWEELL
jgi:hypothetical protein